LDYDTLPLNSDLASRSASENRGHGIRVTEINLMADTLRWLGVKMSAFDGKWTLVRIGAL